MKINVIYDENGNRQLIVEPKEITEEDKKRDKVFSDKFLKSMANNNKIRRSLQEKLNSEKEDEIKLALKDFYQLVSPKKENETQIKASKKIALLNFFLENLERQDEEPRTINIQNMEYWVQFLQQEKIINSAIVLSLWMRKYEQEALEVLSQSDMEINEDFYDWFFDQFEKHIIYDEDCYSTTQKKDSVNKHKNHFFEKIIPIMRHKKLNEELITNETIQLRPKI